MALDELKTLLALNGNQRIAHLEKEIFADEKLYTCYLESICSKYVEYEAYEPGKPGDLSWLAYMYAGEVIKGRWPEAEAVIATDRYWAYRYNVNVTFGTNL
jgi:hypothetical protein